jgi:hypothetical protein
MTCLLCLQSFKNDRTFRDHCDPCDVEILRGDSGEDPRPVGGCQCCACELTRLNALCRICGEQPAFEDGVCRWEDCENEARTER